MEKTSFAPKKGAVQGSGTGTLCKYPLQATEKTVVSPGNKNPMKAKVVFPLGARIVHLGAEPPNGSMFVWAIVQDLKEEARAELNLIVVTAGQEVPPGYLYRGAIVSAPMLLIFERDPQFALHAN